MDLYPAYAACAVIVLGTALCAYLTARLLRRGYTIKPPYVGTAIFFKWMGVLAALIAFIETFYLVLQAPDDPTHRLVLLAAVLCVFLGTFIGCFACWRVNRAHGYR
jgi:hypothetical protein